MLIQREKFWEFYGNSSGKIPGIPWEFYANPEGKILGILGEFWGEIPRIPGIPEGKKCWNFNRKEKRDPGGILGIFFPFSRRGRPGWAGIGFHHRIPEFPSEFPGKGRAPETPELLPHLPEVKIPKIQKIPWKFSNFLEENLGKILEFLSKS